MSLNNVIASEGKAVRWSVAIPKLQHAHFIDRGLPRSFLVTPFGGSLAMTAYIFFILCIALSSCSTRPDSIQSTSSTKFQQYIIQGESLYEKNCSNCHQTNGTGLGLLYPPLNKSDFMDNHFEEVICLMKNGKKGEVIVNGKSFNKEMKGISTLTDLEIAEIATYIYNTWEHQRGIVDVQEVSRIISKCDSVEVIR
ncbi:MAG TPA: cytochrome c [Chryseolinea sp.]|nr:cytochrome c [Chryseolinea sp.]HPM31883.1 cytochrome c [Chryseolinea sp.]